MEIQIFKIFMLILLVYLQRNKLEGSKLNDEERQKYQERISDLERDIIQKEDHLECNKILMDELKQQLDTGLASMNSFKQGKVW